MISPGELAWQDGTQACAYPGVDPEWFFTDDYQMQTVAASVCNKCPLVDACAEYALHHNVVGVWGGMTERTLHATRRSLNIIPKPINGDLFYDDLVGMSYAKRVR